MLVGTAYGPSVHRRRHARPCGHAGPERGSHRVRHNLESLPPRPWGDDLQGSGDDREICTRQVRSMMQTYHFDETLFGKARRSIRRPCVIARAADGEGPSRQSPRPRPYPRSQPRTRTTRGLPLSPRAGRGPAAPRRAAGKRRRSRSEGEGELPEEPPPAQPPHRRLPPRFADDEVDKALSPQAGRGDARAASGHAKTIPRGKASAGGMAHPSRTGDAGRRGTL